MDGPHVFPCSAVFSALSLDDVVLWYRCLLDYGPRDVLIICWGPKEDPWSGGSSDGAQTRCVLLNWSHWACFLEIKKFLTFSRSID